MCFNCPVQFQPIPCLVGGYGYDFHHRKTDSLTLEMTHERQMSRSGPLTVLEALASAPGDARLKLKGAAVPVKARRGPPELRATGRHLPPAGLPDIPDRLCKWSRASLGL